MATTSTTITANVDITSPASGTPVFGPNVTITGTAVAAKATTTTDDGVQSTDVVDLPITKVEVQLGSGAFALAATQGGSFAPVPGGALSQATLAGGKLKFPQAGRAATACQVVTKQ